MIRILIADDHTLFRQGILSMLKDVDEFEIVGDVSNGKELVAMYTELKPDLILTDINMPIKSGPDAIKSIFYNFNFTKVLFLSQFTGDDYLYSVIKAGALGIINKNCMKEELVFAIKEVFAGRKYFKNKTPEELNSIIFRFDQINNNDFEIPESFLTPKEEEVLQLVGEGLTTDQIAEKLNASKRTIDTHRSKIMSTLGLKTASEFIRYAVIKNLAHEQQHKL